jgi:hypothetical protein
VKWTFLASHIEDATKKHETVPVHREDTEATLPPKYLTSLKLQKAQRPQTSSFMSNTLQTAFQRFYLMKHLRHECLWEPIKTTFFTK